MCEKCDLVISRLARENCDLREENERLKLEIEILKSPNLVLYESRAFKRVFEDYEIKGD